MFWNKMKRKLPNNIRLEENATRPIGYGVSRNENVYIQNIYADTEMNNILLPKNHYFQNLFY